jgi:ATP-dependent helicase HrpA
MRFTYPSDLPISHERTRIENAVRSSQVVIVQGQTGSGKTTQIPKMLLEIGRGTHGKRIAHTQPRRIAARSVAERICHEMGVTLGDEIGYQVRFTDQTSPHSRLIIMTDGILLAQIQRDPLLTRYDTIVIDEAHERSLNIDFLLGYLTELLPRRHDLKVVITSATIDAQKFQKHFEKALHHPVPVIEVSGRTYPVTIVYEPAGSPPAFAPAASHTNATQQEKQQENKTAESDDEDHDDIDVPSQVARACQELLHLSARQTGPRDILVFASGERDIRDFSQAIRSSLPAWSSDPRSPRYIEIMPLYARLSSKDQHRVFDRHDHQRIIIATNVAETSLTVPGIRYVVDPGTARISRYSKSAKVQRLPIEPISQASANQRAGRTGRVADGICIRLYSQQDFLSRPQFTDPEILRTSLGAVILHMLSVGVVHNAEDVTHFGFIDPPDMRAVSDGITELSELGAIRRRHGDLILTRIGRRLSRLPIDVRLGRMILQAHAHSTPNVLACVLVIVSFLSLQDPRERPEDHRDDADRIHHRYDDPTSDFLTILNIWDAFYGPNQTRLSHHQMRKRCQEEFLSFIRMRAWNDMYRQLAQVCKEMRFAVGQPVAIHRPEPATMALPLAQQAAHSLMCSWDSDSIHQCILSGLLSNIGMQIIVNPRASQFTGLKGAARARAIRQAQKRNKNNYQGAHGTHFAIFPASALFHSTPEWVMCADLMETSRLWARLAAKIDPAWCELLVPNLLKTTYSAPHWSAHAGAAVATSRVLLYGLPIVSGRQVQWGRIHPDQARDFLIQQGLVDGQIVRRFPYDAFIERNRTIIAQEHESVNRTRQMTDIANDEDLAQFYDRIIPHDVTSVTDLAKWLKNVHATHPHILDFDPVRDVQRLDGQARWKAGDYPSVWKTRGSDGFPLDLPISYAFKPGQKDDGITIHVPLSDLNRLSASQFQWLVPGMRVDLVTGLIKALPKQLRVQFVPAPDSARAICRWIDANIDDQQVPGVHRLPEGTEPEPFTSVFTRAAIATVGAQIHPDDFTEQRLAKLPNYLRVTFSVESTHTHGQNVHTDHATATTPANESSGPVPVASFGQSIHNTASEADPQQENATRSSTARHTRQHHSTVLRISKSLTQLQHDLAAQAQAAARTAIGHSARRAHQHGHLVQSATLLHKAGATDKPREEMLWDAALSQLRLPPQRITSRWLGSEALVLASAPYKSSTDLANDLQLAAVKRLFPDIRTLSTDAELHALVERSINVFEDTVYAVAHDVIAIVREVGKVQKEVSGRATLPMLATLHAIQEHCASLVYPGFIGKTPPQALPNIVRYLKADELRLQKAKVNANRDVKWAWQAHEAQQIVEACQKAVTATPAGPRRDAARLKAQRAQWLAEEFNVSLWGQELGVKDHPSIQRLRRIASQ